MSDDFSARLGLPYLAAGQMQKHVTMNGVVSTLDALLQTAVVSRTITAQPSAPVDGDLYILPVGASGSVWSSYPAGALMRFEAGGWTRVPTRSGLLALVVDAGEALVFMSGGWILLGHLLGQAQSLSRLGVNTEADAANPVSAKVNKMLFTALGASEGGDGDLRLTLNKETPGDVLSLLFQSGYGGRAELGLVGADDLTLKVSADGGTWRTALSVDRSSGRVSFDAGALRTETTVLTAGASWSPPAWARWVEFTAVGGGGGGGSGAAGAAGTSRGGGGGGGAGGLAQGRWPVAALAGGVTVVIGTGGVVGAASSTAGVSGGAGGDSRVLLGGEIILAALGGAGGGGGTTAGGAAGAGGLGFRSGNAGGVGSLTGAGAVGGATACADGPGGGGGGGGVSSANVAAAGGPGGKGAVCLRAANGGAGGSAGVGGVSADAATPAISLTSGGGGGGGAVASGAGFGGGGAGAFGGGGGGGGAGLTLSGAGGAGAAGAVRVTVSG